MNNNTSILLAEDDKNLGTILKAFLEAKGFQVNLYVNGEEALKAFSATAFDFCVLDVMMPVMDGFALAKEIRKTDKKIPLLFLTAKSMQDDILEGFKIGADDYITKPFAMEELLARITAIQRRAEVKREAQNESVYIIGKYSYDVMRQTLTIDDIEQKLTSKESHLLSLLCENKNDLLDRSAALKRIWNNDSYFNARSMDVYVAKLRKYLKEDPTVEILNVHGVGFKLLCPE